MPGFLPDTRWKNNLLKFICDGMVNIVFLNTEHGNMKKEISGFISRMSIDTDIFCFQEADENMHRIADECLPDYESVRTAKVQPDGKIFWQETRIKKTSQILSAETILADDAYIGVGLKTMFRKGNDIYCLINFHGCPRPGDKLDNPDRLRQTEKLLAELAASGEKHVLGGDFNLLPETESVAMFEKCGYVNLINKYEIKTTRNKVAWEKYPDNIQKYADYVFVDRTVGVSDFVVPDEIVSDHQPMILKID